MSVVMEDAPSSRRKKAAAGTAGITRRTSVLVPAFREEVAIGELLGEIGALGPWKEILVVDDGSKDETGNRAAAAGATVIRHPYNKGNGAAVKTAVRAASGEFILLIDADGQHPPGSIPALLAKLDEHDLVVGARSYRGQASFSRALGNAALNRFASMLAGFRIDDLTSGFRAARRDRFREFLHLLPNGFSYPSTSTLAFLKAGYNVAFVPIEGKKRDRRSTSKMRPFREVWRFVMIILRIVTLFSPLRVIVPIALFFFLAGIGYMAYTIATATDITDTSVLLIVFSAVLFVFGLLSEQIAALRFENRDR
ncbi:MAG TPA: glycosyltransferase family 2 protein [Vicinamibacteria bacterium]|nr:glycosyltransferase family 2 protein [Vicinamibacteria bacterium]